MTPSDVSLLHGWLPITVQALAVVALLVGLGRRTPRWRAVCLPVAVAAGVAVAAFVHWRLTPAGLAGDPAPHRFWIWIALTAAAVAVLILGWRRARWWLRTATVLAVPLCLLSTALAVNSWVGYLPTAQIAWNQITAGPLPDQIDQASVTAIATRSQARHSLPPMGSVVPVTIPSTGSAFPHRGELVYLPPAWFASTPPPALPTVMMIGGVINTPADWLRAGDAVAAVDAFAANHHGNAPVLVFADAGGAVKNDTECVNGPRGNAADHLTKDVVPYLESVFGVSRDPANWGIVGWSMGGTCALDLTVMHPEIFRTFVDISGDLGPNTGTKAQTIAALYGGNAAQWAVFDPSSVIAKHGSYSGVSGRFFVTANRATGAPGAEAAVANSLCSLGRAAGIACQVTNQPGKHDWPFAARAFATVLPWLAGTIGTPTASAGIAPTVGI